MTQTTQPHKSCERMNQYGCSAFVRGSRVCGAIGFDMTTTPQNFGTALRSLNRASLKKGRGGFLALLCSSSGILVLSYYKHDWIVKFRSTKVNKAAFRELCRSIKTEDLLARLRFHKTIPEWKRGTRRIPSVSRSSDKAT